MELFIEHSEVTFDKPIRGVAIIPKRPLVITSSTKEVEGDRVYFVRVSNNADSEYNLYDIPDEDSEKIEEIRRELLEKVGGTIFHDYRNTGAEATNPIQGFFKIPKYSFDYEKFRATTEVKFINPIPHELVNGDFYYKLDANVSE